MQWLLTMFGTFLPKSVVFRIWDGLVLDGNEILIRAILSVWKVLEDQILKTASADDFYQLMAKRKVQKYKKIIKNRMKHNFGYFRYEPELQHFLI